MCGEQSSLLSISGQILGSPPRVRGTGRRYYGRFACIRITPACAGNSRAIGAGNPFGRDHPRVCGEQAPSRAAPPFYLGSPPRVRGTVYCSSCGETYERITPACAGNSPAAGRQALTEEDHPRVCGEQQQLACACCYHTGSPPRVRGTGLHLKTVLGAVGITPACAGNRIRA